ncbi:MAG: sigma-70 family RNA polymerase sigma factor [Myxococcales bacterium]|nr:MAG: sigma-70 family RNA polymerase sigma factor [Myxococcales bacterium]
MPLLDPESVLELRPRLVRLAYRMLGSIAEAEDAVQEALLRYQDVPEGVDSPRAYLARMVTRISLDVLKSARRQRETYVGPWLPEPLIEGEESVADDLTLTLMMALERLSPLERAAFLLHDVFEVGLDDIARELGRDPAACRKLATRAREHVKASRPRYDVTPDRGAEIARAFYVASRSGDLSTLRQLLAEDVVVYSDGGGKSSAATKPVLGASRVEKFFMGIARKDAYRQPPYYEPAWIDGLPGYITRGNDGVLQTTAFAIDSDKIVAIYSVRNPDKLTHVANAVRQ